MGRLEIDRTEVSIGEYQKFVNATKTVTAAECTRGGSWWYGASAMLDSHNQIKPVGTAVVYIGFRCARDLFP